MRRLGRLLGERVTKEIDGIIKEDRLGLDIIYIQAKRWESTVGRPEVQKFAGALQGKQARKESSSRHRRFPTRQKRMRRASTPR